MSENIQLIVYPAKDLEASKKLFTAFLGAAPYADTPYYVGFKSGDLEIGLDPEGPAIIAYIDVKDVRESLQTMMEAGATVSQDVKDIGYGMLIAQVKDANGNVVGLRQK